MLVGWFTISFAPITVQGRLGIAFAIMAEASLNFLGLGVDPRPRGTLGDERR